MLHWFSFSKLPGVKREINPAKDCKIDCIGITLKEIKYNGQKGAINYRYVLKNKREICVNYTGQINYCN